MPDAPDKPQGGDPYEGRFTRMNLGRTLIMSLLAMVAGYLIADRLQLFWRDTSSVVREFEVMHTYARITIPGIPGMGRTPTSLADMAEKAVREVNDLMGPFGERSDIRRLNEAGAGVWVEVSPLTWEVVMEALRWNRLTGGAFDPTVGPIKRLFRFDQSESGTWPDPEKLREAQARSGADKLLFEREGMRLAWKVDGMALDLGAIAKGFAADRAAAVLLAHGVKSALIDIGGELRVVGRKPGDPPTPWRAGIRNPRGGDVIMELPLADAAVATSGDYEAYFIYQGKRYEHIIDPRKGLPLTEKVASVTVIHPDSCTAADALATTLCVLGPDEGRTFIEGQALGLFSRGVRVIMLTVGDDGSLRKREITVDAGGETRVADERMEVAEAMES